MPNAIITRTLCYPPFSAASIMDSISGAWVSGGLGILIDSRLVSGTEYKTFEVSLNTNVPKNKCHLQITLNSSRLFSSVFFDGFNPSNNAGANASSIATSYLSAAQLAYNSAFPIVISTVNHPELKLLGIEQIGTYVPIFGIFRPANKPDWWLESVYVYAFMVSPYDYLLKFWPLSAGGNPLNTNNAVEIMNSSGIRYPSSITGEMSMLEGLVLMHPINQGIIGKTSKDLALVPANGLAFGSKYINKFNQEYTLITYSNSTGNNNGAPGIAIRTR